MMWDFYKDETLGDYIDSRLFGDRDPISAKLDEAEKNAIKYSQDDVYKKDVDDSVDLQRETNTKEDLTKDSLLNPNAFQANIKDEMVVEGKQKQPNKEEPATAKEKPAEQPKKDNNIELKTAKIIQSLANRVKNKEAMDILTRLQEKVDAQESAKRNQIIDKETGIRDKVQERRNSGNFSNDEWSKIFKNLLKK